jgi:hypothetical protein
MIRQPVKSKWFICPPEAEPFVYRTYNKQPVLAMQAKCALLAGMRCYQAFWPPGGALRTVVEGCIGVVETGGSRAGNSLSRPRSARPALERTRGDVSRAGVVGAATLSFL